ncbi:PHD finger protein family [Quillaja saponaria]|uniref:PHD finger protein family n=1 Tax=Quillaja saponaria TaxID=32244 RepID=A0AAD7PEU6_QUISA|nr:PHD finger protein family [Quillaja saponaria]
MRGRSHRLQSSDPPDDWVDGSWTVDCVCGVTFDDGEEMVNCDECGVWVHTRCSRYVKGDDVFACDKCKSKNNRNDTAETEVAQLLVELPTKTMRMETSFASNGHSRRPFRLWTDIPIEERVHVQGIPGGDSSLFGGLSSVFTPQLWKCTGYVPQKFNFQYREFPCWDEKNPDSRMEENESLVDKGAGVLFSLSKENVLATPLGTLPGMRDEEDGFGRKTSLKAMKWGSDNKEGLRLANHDMKERSLLSPVAMHSEKRNKEDYRTSKDRCGKKRTRASDKEADAKRSSNSSKTAFTPASGAKQLEFYEDRGPNVFKADTWRLNNKNFRGTVVQEQVRDDYHVSETNLEELNSNVPSSADNSKDLRTDIPMQAILVGAVPKEVKSNHKVPTVTEISPRTDVTVKEEGDGQAVDISLNSVAVGSAVRPPSKDLPTIARDFKGYQALESNGDMALSSVLHNFKVKREEDDVNSSKFLSSDHMSDNSEGNNAIASSLLSCEVQEVGKIPEIVSEHTDIADELSGQMKLQVEGSEGSMDAHKCFSEIKVGLEEQSKSSGTISISQALVCESKLLSSGGKLFQTSSTMVSKSPSNELKPEDTENPNSIAKQQMVTDCNVHIKKDGGPTDVVRDEELHELPRKTVKERTKYSTTTTFRALHSSRSLQDSVSKQINSDSKDPVICSSSKASSAQNTATNSMPGESTGLFHHQKALQALSKSSISGLPQRVERPNQTNIHSSSKLNQNNALSVYPSTTSNSAALSDEELALLLHQELNSSPRVPRVPRARHAGSLPQLTSPTATSILIKRTSGSGGKDHSLVSRRKYRDTSRDGFCSSRELEDEAKKVERVSSFPDQRKQDTKYTEDASVKDEGDGSSTAVQPVMQNVPSASTATSNCDPSSPPNDRNLSSIHDSPRNISDDDTSTVGGPVHRTLPGLINEIMSKGRRMTYEELCNAVLPHWHNLRKHNGERYAYSSPSQAVLDCLRNRHEWARLVDRGPKTNSNRKRRKVDAEESDDNENGKGRSVKEGKSLELQKEEFPKGKRKARKRRRLALQGRAVKDVRRRHRADLQTDEDIGPLSNSSEESLFSEDDIQGGGTCPVVSEASASSDEAGNT